MRLGSVDAWILNVLTIFEQYVGISMLPYFVLLLLMMFKRSLFAVTEPKFILWSRTSIIHIVSPTEPINSDLRDHTPIARRYSADEHFDCSKIPFGRAFKTSNGNKLFIFILDFNHSHFGPIDLNNSDLRAHKPIFRRNSVDDDTRWHQLNKCKRSHANIHQTKGTPIA